MIDFPLSGGAKRNFVFGLIFAPATVLKSNPGDSNALYSRTGAESPGGGNWLKRKDSLFGEA